MVRVRFRIGFCLAVVATSLIVLGTLFTGPIASAADPPANARAIAKVMQIQDRHTNRLMAIPGVVGTATGLNPAGQPVVKVFLARGGVRGIPAKLDGVRVAVEVTGVFVALKPPADRPAKPLEEGFDPTARHRPAPIGVSTGHPDITAGTIGCRVRDAGGNVYALSNNHVYADCNNASSGDNVLQPGTYDGGVDPDDAIGTLFAFEPIEFGPKGTNTIDAAIAECLLDSEQKPLVGNSTPPDGYGTPNSVPVPVEDVYIGLKVQKYGRTTELTNGVVSGVNATVSVGYAPRWALFTKQIIVTSEETFSAGGDSGSLVVVDDDGGDDDRKPVGLLFAGSATTTICNPIGLVLARFGVTIDDGAPPNIPPVVTITSPADDSTFDSGEQIIFEGTATDTEDGDVTASLVWTSSIDGPIGIDGSLSDGTHTITASVTDSGGATGSDSISITVGVPQGVTVDMVDPDSGAPGDKLTVVVTGSNFQDGATADFGERVTVQEVTFINSGQLNVSIKIHPRAAPGPRDVTVSNPDGSSGVLEGQFDVTQ